MHTANTFVSNIQIGNANNDAALGIISNGSLGDAANTVTLG